MPFTIGKRSLFSVSRPIYVRIISIFGVLLIDLYVKQIFAVVKVSLLECDSKNNKTFTPANNNQ